MNNKGKIQNKSHIPNHYISPKQNLINKPASNQFGLSQMAQSQYCGGLPITQLACSRYDQTQVDFGQSKKSNGSEVVIEISRRLQSSKNSKQLLEEFIETYYGRGNIKIIVTCHRTYGKQYLQEETERFKQLKYSVKQIKISEEEKLFQQRIYKFKGQSENNINSFVQMIIYIQSYIQQFNEDLEMIGGEIHLSYEGHYLQIPQIFAKNADDDDLYSYFDDKVYQTLDNLIILEVECSSNAEANAKHKLLNNSYVLDQLQKKLNFSISKLSFLDFNHLKQQLSDNIEQLSVQLKHNRVYLLIQKSEHSIEEQQNKLNKLLRTKDIIKQESISERIRYYDSPSDNNEIQIKIDRLKDKYPEISIEISECQTLEDKSLIIQITISTWIQRDRGNQEFIRNATDIKTQIEKILLPQIPIKLDSQQKDIWENHLQQYFQKYQSCFTIQNQGGSIRIDIKTDSEKWREFEKQINKAIQTFKSENIKIQSKIFSDWNPRGLLEEKHLFQLVFKKLFVEYEGSVSIIIQELDEFTFTFKIIYDSEKIQLQQIKNILENKFVRNLKKVQLKYPYKECLKQFKIETPEQIKNQDIYVHQTYENEPTTIFLGLKEDIIKLDPHLNVIGNKFQKDWMEQIIQVENTLLFNQLHSRYILKEIKLKQGSSIQFKKATKATKATKSSSSQILIKGFQNELIDLLKNLSIIEDYIMSTISVKSTNLDSHSIQKLVKMPESLLKLENSTSTYFEIKKIISFNPDKAVLSRLTFEGKELSIVKGDITQIQCQAIVNQILNDKCELGKKGMQSQQVKNLIKLTDKDIKEFFKSIINQKTQLKEGDLFYYKVKEQCHIDHIFNIYPPTYRQSKTLNRGLDILKNLIKTVFEEAKQKQIKQIAFPVISIETFGFYTKTAIQTLLIEIINNLFESNCDIQQIFIVENEDKQFLLKNDEQQRAQNYSNQQWQWFEQDHYEDYDEFEINQKICEMYQKFQNSGQDQHFKIKYPYSKYPGTHLIDLDKQKIWDKTHNNSEQTLISIDNCGQRKYYIDGKQVEDELNRFLIQQEIQQKRKFDIFYKFYEISLTSKGFYQKNVQYGNTRPIQFITCQTPNIENGLINTQSKFKYDKLVNPINISNRNKQYKYSYKINPEYKTEYDDIKIYTCNEDETVPEQKLIELLQNSNKIKGKNENTQKTEQNEFIIRKQLLSPKRFALQNKN